MNSPPRKYRESFAKCDKYPYLYSGYDAYPSRLSTCYRWILIPKVNMKRTTITLNITFVGPLLSPRTAAFLILVLHWLGFL